MPDHSFSKDIFPNTQSKPPLTQLEAMMNLRFLLDSSSSTGPGSGGELEGQMDEDTARRGLQFVLQLVFNLFSLDIAFFHLRR